MNKNFIKFLKLFSVSKLVLVLFLLAYKYYPSIERTKIIKEKELVLKFGDNIEGYGEYIVPNIVHFIRFGNKSNYLDFISFISLKSVLINQNPERVYIHCDCTQLWGQYWDLIEDKDRITVRFVEMPTHVFGTEISQDWKVWHASDITRLEVLLQFGGIYLDNDVYVLKSMDKFRVFEMCLGVDPKSIKKKELTLGNQVMVAHKNARFLRRWYESYRQYDPDQWYFNAGVLPARVLSKSPQLVHKVKTSFGVDTNVFGLLYDDFDQQIWDYLNLYAVHLLSNHRYYLDKYYQKIPDFNELNIRRYPKKFGELARLMYYGSKHFVD